MKIRMIRKQAEILFEDGSSLEGFFFLSPTSAHRLGPESMEELLNGDRSFLPLELNREDVALVSRNAIVMVLTAEKGEETIPRGPAKIAAEITLRSGKTLQGNIRHDLPETHSRLSDFVNRSGTFFHIEIASQDCFVATAFVKLIKPMDSAKRSVSA